MLKKFFVRLEIADGYYALGLWPIGADTLASICTQFATASEVFVAVRDKETPEGFHPPEPQELRLWPIKQLGIARLNWAGFIKCLKDETKVNRVIDLLAYCPILPPTDVVRLSAAFQSSGYADTLSEWGGYWAYLHDSEDLHFFVDPDVDSIKRLLHAVLCQIDKDERCECVEKIASRLSKIKREEVLQVRFFGRRCDIRVAQRAIWWDWKAVMCAD